MLNLNRRLRKYSNQPYSLLLACLGTIALFFLGCDSSADKDLQEKLLRAKRRQETELRSTTKSREDRLGSASTYIKEGNPVSAESELRPLLLTNPNDAEVLILVAQAQAISGQKTEAIKTLIRLDPKETNVALRCKQLVAKWSIDLAMFKQAEAQLKSILELPVDPVEATRMLAGILNNQGRRREAGHYMTKLAKAGKIKEKELIASVALGDPFTDPDLPVIEASKTLTEGLLQVARENRGKEMHRNAIGLCEPLAAKFPDSTPISAFLGRLYADQQNAEQLRKWLERVPTGIEIEPEYWHAYATLMKLEQRPEQAVRCLLETVRRDETNWLAYLELARILHQIGKTSLAKSCQLRVEQIKETNQLAISLGLQRGSSEQLLRLADLMEELERPWESFAWRKIALKQQGASEMKQKALETSRIQFLDTANKAALETEPANILCGLTLSNWPLPKKDLRRDLTPQTLPSSPKDESIPPALVNIAKQTGLHFQYKNGQDTNSDDLFIHQVTGGGIGVIDFDLDGWPDLYFSQGGGQAFDASTNEPDQVFRNLGGRKWKPSGMDCGVNNLGYGQGVAAADLNQDGWQDLVVANLGENIIYQNNGDGSFTRVNMPKHPLNIGGWTTSIACGDITGDHLPEIFEVNYLEDPSALEQSCGDGTIACNPVSFQSARNHVLSVKQDGSISQNSSCVGLNEKANYGFGVVIANFDKRAGNDVFIANDTQNNHLWVSQPKAANQNSHQLIESASILGCAVAQNGLPRGCMGIAFGDFDRNQSIDLYVSNFWKQAADLYLLQESGSFSSGSYRLGLYEESVETVGWGCQAADFDHDGWLDIAVLNGHVTDLTRRGQPYRMLPQLFRGSRDGFSISRPFSQNDQNYWSDPALGRTLAILDWNCDGRIDLVANHLDQPVALLENQTQTGERKSVRLELIGTESERDAVGASVKIQHANTVWSNWQIGGDGFLCSNQNEMHFGVGDIDLIETITIQWPSGSLQTFESVATGQSYLVVEDQNELTIR